MAEYKLPSTPTFSLVWSENWGTYGPEYLAKVLDLVIVLFKRVFGEAAFRAKKVTIRVSAYSYPYTSPTYDTLYITNTEGAQNQQIFQFCHEMCHIMVGAMVSPRYRWVEEAVCETASHFFLLETAKAFVYHALVAPEYAGRTLLYAYARQSEAYPLGKQTVAQVVNDHIDLLEQDPYRRDINNQIAINLLPLFLNMPGVWKEVSGLARIPEGLPYPEYCYKWAESMNASNRPVAARYLRSMFAQT